MKKPKTVFRKGKIKMFTNGFKHECRTCVHKEYCEKTKESLFDNPKSQHWFGDNNIYIPDNCPVVDDREKVVFT